LLKDGFGRIIGTLTSGEDITERKKAEEALRASKEKFSKVFEFGPDAISIASLEDGKYLDVNDIFLETTGFQRNEVIGQTSSDLNVMGQ
jgi:PAS domain-containing protein